jgi:hypothetical protein
MPHARALRGVFPPELRAQATAVACSLPRSQEVVLAHWSIGELARYLASQPALDVVSVGTLARWLGDERIRPWRFRMWQHIQDPLAFLARARPVLDSYAIANSLLKAGTWLVCVDEKTSIQAREADVAPQAAIAGACQRQSPRYTRHGARHLIAGLSVADGHVCGHVSVRKRFVDFQAFLTTVLVPQAQQRGVHTVRLVLDNGPTHAPKQLERWLAEQTRSQGWGLRFEVQWLPTNASWLDQIEIWFSILQRKLLRPNHFVSITDLEEAMLAFITHYNQTAKPIKWTYTTEKLERKLAKRGSHI